MILTQIEIAAMGRGNVPESQRQPFHLYIDEAGVFAKSDSLSNLLSEGRNFSVSCTLANQFAAQYPRTIMDAIFGNVGTFVALQVGSDDAEMLCRQMGGGLLPEDLVNLPRHTAYVRTEIDGRMTPPFTIATLPPAGTIRDGSRKKVIQRRTRQQYGGRGRSGPDGW